jgi:hypothetical protein
MANQMINQLIVFFKSSGTQGMVGGTKGSKIRQPKTR